MAPALTSPTAGSNFASIRAGGVSAALPSGVSTSRSCRTRSPTPAPAATFGCWRSSCYPRKVEEP